MSLANARLHARPWSPRSSDPVPYGRIVALANACQRHPGHGGRRACSQDVSESHGDQDRGERPVPGVLAEPLSRRELEVLSAVCDGDSNVDIGRRLGIETATVKYHVLQIFGKLGVQRRTQAVGIAIHLGLVQPDWLPSTKRSDGGSRVSSFDQQHNSPTP